MRPSAFIHACRNMDDVARGDFFLLLPDPDQPLTRLHDEKLLALWVVVERGNLTIGIKCERSLHIYILPENLVLSVCVIIQNKV